MLSPFPWWSVCCCSPAGVLGLACSGRNGTAWSATASAQVATLSMTSSIASLAGRNPMNLSAKPWIPADLSKA
ncbi:hypothetical protein B0H67DRAFT_567554 [Lasiosphaeris hirsuta]|uniref:Secreted protein n=1 Tax=Lasiosphaeris hirsuta TaxID=260670 RepID=A0AA40E6H5_9PEZI|nr:hypothetical protein B0H67DRAFT_567554 [Lasiosphaeris hirsuta]